MACHAKSLEIMSCRIQTKYWLPMEKAIFRNKWLASLTWLARSVGCLMNKNYLLFLSFYMLIILIASAAYAQEQIPIGLQRIIDYNNQASADFALRISLVIAFV